MKTRRYSGFILTLALCLLLVTLVSTSGNAADVIANGFFDTDITTGWTDQSSGQGSSAWDDVTFGNTQGSLRGRTITNQNQQFELDFAQTVGPINSTDVVNLSFWWYKWSEIVQANRNTMILRIIKPAGDSTDIWTHTTIPGANSALSGNYNSDVSIFFDQTGSYTIRLIGDLQSGADNNAYTQCNFDDVILDVQAAPNNAPQITGGATQASLSPVNRYGSNTTVISTDFTDTDDPGVGTFNVTFKIREPNDITELMLVNNQSNGGGGLTITDNGGGSYTANYTYNPDDAQTLGLYDLYFEVTDGTDNVIDDYADNLNELEISETLPNNAPQITGGATQVSVSPIDRNGAGTTILSTDFTDSDQPAVGSFNVTFKIREPNNSTEITLVINQPHGAGGLTITDQGGGSYTASYNYNPYDGQALGFYDLYCEVTDGTDNAIDGYANNLDELEINEVLTNNAPQVAPGGTEASISPINRLGGSGTVLGAAFYDVDQPGVGAFTVTIKIREPNNVTELFLVNDLAHGAGGLTIIANGGGWYTASYTYNPGDGQTLGLYDLYFAVSDGVDNDIDDYTNNLDELEINEVIANNAPQIVAGVTGVSGSPINRFGLNNTVISADFSDSDQPGITAFRILFKIREPDNSTELVLVNNLPHGVSGLTITDNGGGSYTASYTYNPDDAQTLGNYDLYCWVTDGVDNTVDDYANNLDELELNEAFVNNPPEVTGGATRVSVSPANRSGTNTTLISATFSDRDNPGVGAFNVTFKIREPNNSTEVVLVNNLTDGAGGLTITDNTGSYTARYTYDPSGSQTLGLYDLYFEVTDGTDNVIDDYANNLDELEIVDVPANNPPVLAAGVTAVNPSSVDRFGGGTSQLSATFTDADVPGVSAFFVTFVVREPYDGAQLTIADVLQHGQGGLTITDGGGGSYTTQIDWNPPDNSVLGYYDLYCLVSDGTDQTEDDFAQNDNELLLTNGGENAPPVVPADNVFASPAGVERIGANPTTVSATFTDADSPAIGVFAVTFKLRLPDNSSELILADNLGHGAGGVSIIDQGGGIYTASISWDPPDAQTLGVYDIYFHVTDGAATSYDVYYNNLDELEIYDAISNSAPTLVAGNTVVLPTSITRFGSEYTMIQTVFSDIDVPGRGAFTVTIKVRDQSSTEYTLVNAAGHREQGLRIRHVTGNDYEASVLWDPPVGQVTGTYDLYFYVEDNDAAAATDGYTNNADELTITPTALAGDGNLLRRTNDANNCGGANSACHNIADHQSQDCMVCHTPHSTANIYLVRDTINTPNSGLKEVVFKTLGIGDPYNDPDPTPGDPTSGVMADSLDGVFTGVCEVCHRTTTHHTNDGIGEGGTQLAANHNDALDCTVCHPHSDGFAVSGGGESSGGASCTCHSSIFASMDSTATTIHRHILANTDADYTGNLSGVYLIKNCLTCHVDHDIFRPDLNPGFGQRGKNLRVDYGTTPILGDNTVLANSDYSSTGLGGLCLSCHSGPNCDGCHSLHLKAASFDHQFIPKSDYDAATSAHNYDVAATFSTDGSTFNRNCTKCHSDDLAKSYQSSTYKVSAHGSNYSKILDATGVSAPADPLEEGFCFKCHSTTSNPNAGANLDYFGVQSMSNQDALGIEAAFSRTYTHPTATYSGRHIMGETGTDLADGNRHAECEDCHNPHAAQQGTHDGSSNLVSNALKGTWGVEPTSWPTPATPSDNANVFTVPSGYTKLEPAVKEYQICLKCHSNYTTLPSGARNLAEEINPNYPSTHGIVQPGTNAYCNTNTMNEPWASSGITYCSDCHRSDISSDPEGPHGSNMEHLLVATVVSNNNVGTPLCYVCHKETEYWSDGTNFSRFPDHPASKGAHKRSQGCFGCHMWDYSSTAGLGVSTTDWSGGNPPAGIFVHGQNKKWVYNERDGTSGSGQPVDAFVNGYIEDMDYNNRRCWSATCKSHSDKGY